MRNRGSQRIIAPHARRGTSWIQGKRLGVSFAMTELLKKAFREASKLSPDRQNSFAAFVLAELDSEARWEEAFSRSRDLLEKLAREALAEDEAGNTQLLVPEEL